MSGIAGIVNFCGEAVPPDRIHRMTHAMQHRGPDGEFHHQPSPHIALGYCALHTTQEALEESQPVINQDNDLIMVMDGRLDNWQELRDSLLKANVVLRNRSDAELALAGYRYWGEDCLKRFRGDFAFAVWHRLSNTLVCARDQIGIKPFHYYLEGNTFYFASEVAAILAVTGNKTAPNRGMIAECLSDQWCSRDETLWQGIFRLLPAHRLVVADNRIESRRYWSPDFSRRLAYRDANEYTEHYLDIFKDTVRRQSRTHQPLAIEVSGGLDSSAVFAIAHHLHTENRLPVPTMTGYTINFEGDADADEISYVRAINQHLNTRIIETSPAFPSADWYEQAARRDRDLPGFPNSTMALNELQEIRDSGGRVLLDGIGGDEWLDAGWVGYDDEFANGNYRTILRLLASQIGRTGLVNTAMYTLRSVGAHLLDKRLTRRLRGQTQLDGAYWLSDQLQAELLEQQKKHIAPVGRDDALPGQRRQLATLHNAYIAQNHLLNDRLAARYGLEFRHPFYSLPMVEFAMHMPAQFMFANGIHKYSHRRAMAGFLPEDILRRTSEAEFSVTFRHYLKSLQSFDFDRLSDWVDPGRARKLLNHYQQTGEPVVAMWLLCSLAACDNIFYE